MTQLAGAPATAGLAPADVISKTLWNQDSEGSGENHKDEEEKTYDILEEQRKQSDGRQAQRQALEL